CHCSNSEDRLHASSCTAIKLIAVQAVWLRRAYIRSGNIYGAYNSKPRLDCAARANWTKLYTGAHSLISSQLTTLLQQHGANSSTDSAAASTIAACASSPILCRATRSARMQRPLATAACCAPWAWPAASASSSAPSCAARSGSVRASMAALLATSASGFSAACARPHPGGPGGQELRHEGSERRERMIDCDSTIQLKCKTMPKADSNLIAL
uniref:SCP domain-containing protein n=1 Tax=Macrostomum lignano TaxID=282301 RepID=A0A1I8FT20_9PLAT